MDFLDNNNNNNNSTSNDDIKNDSYLDSLHELIKAEKPCISDSVKNLVSLFIAKHQVSYYY